MPSWEDSKLPTLNGIFFGPRCPKDKMHLRTRGSARESTLGNY